MNSRVLRRISIQETPGFFRMRCVICNGATDKQALLVKCTDGWICDECAHPWFTHDQLNRVRREYDERMAPYYEEIFGERLELKTIGVDEDIFWGESTSAQGNCSQGDGS